MNNELTKDIDFDLQKWQTGEYDVFTRDKDEVTQLTNFEVLGDRSLAGVRQGYIHLWFKNGKHFNDPSVHHTDLFLRPKVKTLYYNVYLRRDGFASISDMPFHSKENGEKYGKTRSNYIKTIPVTNEPE